MVICTFYQQGRCKYGDRCRYEHPGQTTAGSAANRFSALSSGGTGGRRPPQQSKPLNYGVTVEDLKADLNPGVGRPDWIFSAYGPGKNPPRQLFGGPQRERSFEEMRLRHYELAAQGNMNLAVQEAIQLHEDAQRQINITLGDLNGAVKYIADGENEHPNRIDVVEGKKAAAPSGFGQPQTQSSFGQQQPAAPTSAPAFGQPSAIGQPSPLGGNNPAFGQPSGLGQSQPAFGQPSGLGNQGPAFGKPSVLGGGGTQPAFGQPAFGQPAFGQPSVPGGGTSTVSPFVQAAQAAQPTGGFGQPSTAAPFGQPAAQTTPSPFGQPAAQQTGGFGQPSAPTTGGFGQPSQAPNPFTQAQQQSQPNSNAFGQPQQRAAAAPGGSGQPSAAAAAPQQPQPPASGPKAGLGPQPRLRVSQQELNPFPFIQGQTIRDPISKKLTMWKGRPVQYNKDDWPCYLHPDDNKTFVRIHFPEGPPELSSLRDTQEKDEDYTPEIAERYQFFVENGYFKEGCIPAVPPRTEWVSFDF